MMASIKQAAWLCCILALLACSSWYFAKGPTQGKLDEQSLSTTPDMYIHHLTVSKFDQTGLLANQLVTPFAKHYPKNDSHVFKTPHILVNQKDQPSWDIKSLKARSVQGGKKIIFTEQVIIHQNKGTNSEESTLTTEKMIYFPKKKKATSDILVTFEQPGNIMQSTGMTAYLSEKRVKLLHQARGKYAPKVG